MRGYWYIAAESAELKTRPIARRILGDDLVLFRGAKGQAAALFDRCPHRAVQLSTGRVHSGRLACPYHGWEFDTHGHCQRIPSMCQNEGIPSTACTPAFSTVEQDGYVWVYMGQENGDPAPKGSVPLPLPYRDEAEWGRAQLQTFIPNQVENVVENFIDCPHTGYVHGGLFRTPASHSARTVVRAVADGVVIDIDEEQQTNSILGRLLVPKGAQVTHQDRFYLPATVQVAYDFGPGRRIIGFQICTPVSEYETRVYVYLTWRMGWLTHLMTPLMPWVGRLVLDQDMGVLVNQGQVVQKTGARFVSCPADTANLWIRAARERAARGEPPLEREKHVEFRL
ncbi:MAG: aromatic ring-hydroxylating dioxygenase subunit alpha [Candidatus Sericytochromatia bacterium]|nr:aromatic ring-hydroxylating dioxygenase subunit alpha [Candidatus Sericytochromatia bacterium]